jgi:hypoxanthine phosphoribosyltransferase
MTRSERPLFTAADLRSKVHALADAISRDLDDGGIVALIVLKGALHFGSDLLRALRISATVDFVQARSYNGTGSRGAVTMLARPTQELRGRRVLIIEDILDTGVTANALLDFVRAEGAADVRFCALFDKPSRRRVPVHADYLGFTVEDVFLVGYGMDYEEQYRELPDVYTLEP